MCERWQSEMPRLRDSLAANAEDDSGTICAQARLCGVSNTEPRNVELSSSQQREPLGGCSVQECWFGWRVVPAAWSGD